MATVQTGGKMLIVITKDPTIVNYYQTGASNSGAWGNVYVLNAAHNQDQANLQLIGLLGQLQPNEPLCFAGHGDDKEVGGENVGTDTWTWNSENMASLLNTELGSKPRVVLFEVCSNDPGEVRKSQVEGFVTNVAHSFRSMQVSNRMSGVWIYGYHASIDARHTLPNPDTIGKDVQAQGSRIG
jgi:hypothetical protein